MFKNTVRSEVDQSPHKDPRKGLLFLKSPSVGAKQNEAGGILLNIAGHSSINMSNKYVPPFEGRS